jgi:hypothetical protein
MTSAGVSRLSDLCRGWGGRLTVLDSEGAYLKLFTGDGMLLHASDLDLHDAPFCSFHGVRWRAKEIVTVKGWACTSSLIHEMGHVFACHVSPEEVSDELAFFGWEVAVARMIGCCASWSRDNAHYAITEQGDTWGDASPYRRRTFANQRVATARQIGLLDEHLRPISVR